jgi:hypothetical protein
VSTRVPIRALLVVAVVGTSWLSAGSAEASPTDEPCFEAAANGQRERNEGHLLSARAQFDICAQPTCDAKVVQRCVGWLAEVDEATPSIVLAVQDASGRDLVDVSVSIDGVAREGVIGGRATPIDPGPHVLRFMRPGADPIERSIVMREREKARLVRAVFAAPAAAPAVPTSTAPRAVPVSVYVLGGVGIAAVAVATYFAIGGLGDRSRFGCAAGCSREQADTVSRQLLVADIASAVGIVALGAAAWLYLTRPSPSHVTSRF